MHHDADSRTEEKLDFRIHLENFLFLTSSIFFVPGEVGLYFSCVPRTTGISQGY